MDDGYGGFSHRTKKHSQRNLNCFENELGGKTRALFAAPAGVAARFAQGVFQIAQALF